MAFSQIFQDLFTGTGALGANWDTSAGSASKVTDKCEFGQSGLWIQTTTSAHAATADIRVSVSIAGTSSDGGPLLRVTGLYPPTGIGYGLYITASAYSFYRHQSGSELQLATGSLTNVADAVAYAECIGSGTVAWAIGYNGSELDAGSDVGTGAPFQSVGRAGLVNWSVTTAQRRFDNFTVEEWTAGGAAFLAKTNRPFLQAVHRSNSW